MGPLGALRRAPADPAIANEAAGHVVCAGASVSDALMPRADHSSPQGFNPAIFEFFFSDPIIDVRS